ncbi:MULTISPECIES: hypothetical protein [Burkholderia]|uniref:hypothetical protein n=1 Tax=Burkholderia TaxID=32008 RepID=UPI00158DFD21|nr:MULTISPECIES: hypothetical protein [Burkholderia]
MTVTKRWIMEIQDAPDGSGDGVLQLPDDLWSELSSQGWQAGDVLEVDLVTVPGVAGIRNRYAECRRISAPGKSVSNGPPKSEDGHER